MLKDRITSYNVCYTKLLRRVTERAAPGVEDHDRLRAGGDLGIQVDDYRVRQFRQQAAAGARVIPFRFEFQGLQSYNFV